MRPENSKFPSLLRTIEYETLVKAISSLMLKKHKYLLTPESQQSLSLQRQHLHEGSIVIYFNHLTQDDPFLIGALAFRSFGGRITGAVAPIGVKHIVQAREKKRLRQLLLTLTPPFFGIELPPAPQPYYTLENPPRELTPGAMNRNLVKLGRKILGKPGGLFLIAPEATRSHDSKLQPAHSGIGHLHRYGPAVRYAPWAVIPLEPIDREGGLGKVRLSIGAARTQEEILSAWKQNGYSQEVELKDILMYELAAHLPNAMRGVYATPPQIQEPLRVETSSVPQA